MCIICENKYSEEDSIKLDINNCYKLTYIPNNLPFLDLYVSNCPNLKKIEDGNMFENIIIKNCKSLENLKFENCESIQILHCKKLKQLNLESKKLKEIQLNNCGLEIINIEYCQESFILSSMQKLKELNIKNNTIKDFEICNCNSFNFNFDLLKNHVENLKIWHFYQNFLDLKNFQKLQRLEIYFDRRKCGKDIFLSNNKKLVNLSISNIENLYLYESEIKELSLTNIKNLQKIENLHKLNFLVCNKCNNLKYIKNNNLNSELSIIECRIITEIQESKDRSIYDCYWYKDSHYQNNSYIYNSKIKKLIILQRNFKKYLKNKKKKLNEELLKYLNKDVNSLILDYDY